MLLLSRQLHRWCFCVTRQARHVRALNVYRGEGAPWVGRYSSLPPDLGVDVLPLILCEVSRSAPGLHVGEHTNPSAHRLHPSWEGAQVHIADCPALSFVFVFWEISGIKINWVRRSTNSLFGHCLRSSLYYHSPWKSTPGIKSMALSYGNLPPVNKQENKQTNKQTKEEAIEWRND